MVFKYLGQKATYFCDFTFRESAGFWYKTWYLSIRNLLRAVIFCFMHYQFREQLIFLGFIEILMIIVTIILESSYRIFKSKLIYVVNLIYSFLFVLLNLTLLIEDTQTEREVLEQLEAS